MSAAPASCVICGVPEPLGLSVCPDCGGTAESVGDTLIFVKPEGAQYERREAGEALDELLEGRAHRGERRLVAAGHKALVRVPASIAASVVRHLAVRGVPALSRAARTVIAPLPATFLLLIAAIVVTGTWAGMTVLPMLLWSSPLVALMLLVAAQLRLRQPAIDAPKRRPAFPALTEKLVVQTLSELPESDARDLLASLVRSGESVYRPLHQSGATSLAVDVRDLLHRACSAAIDLAVLEKGLAILSGEPGTERAAKLRDRLEAKFRQGIHVLHRLHAESVDADPVHGELADVLNDLREEADAYAEARREVESLL